MRSIYTTDTVCYLEYDELPDGTLEIVGCQGDMMPCWTVSIPSSINGKSVSTISRDAFFSLDTPIYIEIEEGISKIEANAFWSMYIREVNIPDSVKCIEGNPFYGEQFLKRKLHIKISPNHPYFVIDDDILFGKSDKRIISYLQNERTSYNIPQGIKTVGKYAFRAPLLKSILIPDSVVALEDEAFTYCKELSAIQGCEGVQSIGRSCFSSCCSLKQFIIPPRVVYTDSYRYADRPSGEF